MILLLNCICLTLCDRFRSVCTLHFLTSKQQEVLPMHANPLTNDPATRPYLAMSSQASRIVDGHLWLQDRLDHDWLPQARTRFRPVVLRSALARGTRTTWTQGGKVWSEWFKDLTSYSGFPSTSKSVACPPALTNIDVYRLWFLNHLKPDIYKSCLWRLL